jgi:hypothetical protein
LGSASGFETVNTQANIMNHLANCPNQPASDEKLLDAVQRDAFGYFLRENNSTNGLVADRTQPDAPASIAAVGFALAAYTVGVERSWMTRAEAAARTLAVLRFFWQSPQGTAPDATGYQGFYYHFLDMKTGRRAGRCELSTVDTAFLLAGMLTAAIYFDQDGEDEREIRALADALYRRADWRWAQNGGTAITHGWKPESGFLKHRWEGYDESLLLYALGLGSPTYPLPIPRQGVTAGGICERLVMRRCHMSASTCRWARNPWRSAR